MPVSTIRNITELHARKMHDQREILVYPTTSKGVEQQIVETDGCMLPVFTVREDEGDRRKKKKLHWKEGRLALAHEQGSVSPKFDATFDEGVDAAGQSLVNCAILAGLGTNTKIHSVGDGAPWIEDQVKKKFKSKANYLIDFYHICEYLSDASKSCASNEDNWIETQKAFLKANQYTLVLENLKLHLEIDDIDDKKAPVRACYRYLSNRTDQLDYKGAIEKELPIGSGEIESAHRYVIQKRLKLSGAWWKVDNLRPMLTLRVIRANGEWEKYWDNSAVAA